MKYRLFTEKAAFGIAVVLGSRFANAPNGSGHCPKLKFNLLSMRALKFTI